MMSNRIGRNSHRRTLFSPQFYSLTTSSIIRPFECLDGAGKKSRFSTTSKQSNASSLTRSPSILAGRHSNLMGRLYEKHSLKCMREVLLFKDLVHVGKKSSQDGGIDIKGWLYLKRRRETKNPSEEHSKAGRQQHDSDESTIENQERFIKAIAQCKCARAELRLVRELEGLVGASSTHNDSKPIVGVLFSSRGFTSASLTQAERSPFPLILVTLDFPKALLSISEDTHPGDILTEDDDGALHPPCKISHCYPNPVAVKLIRPFEFVRISKLTTNSLPAQHSWILIKQENNR